MTKWMTAGWLAVLIACSGSPKPETEQPAPAPAPTSSADTAVDAPAFDPAHIAAELDPYLSGVGKSWGPAFQYSGYVHLQSGDQVLFSRGYGYADHATSRANTVDTSFRIGSVTKQFTAAAILLLQEEGALKVTDTISAHLPDYPAEVAGTVTIHQLLNHTSGIPSYTSLEIFESRDKPHTVDELMASFRDLPLELEPGSEWSYSNSGYVVLGAIIEKASGMTYAEFLRTRLFEPSGMNDTVVGDAESAQDRALGYTGRTGAVELADPIDMSVPFAAGAVRSTCADMVRWDHALRAGTVVSAALQDAMFTPSAKMGDDADYGYGWTLTGGEHRFAHHGGGIDGFSTYYLRGLDHDLVLCMWANNSMNNVTSLKDVAVSVAFGAEAPAHDEAGPAGEDLDEQAKLAGTYTRSEAGQATLDGAGVPAEAIDTFRTIEVRSVDGTLIIKPVGQPESSVIRTAPATYFSPMAQAEFVFVLDGEQATELQLSQGGFEIVFERN